MNQRLAVVSLSILLFAGGCRTPVPVSATDVEQVLQPGDRLRVRDASGAETRLVLERIEPDALVGRDGTRSVRVPRADWTRIARMEIAWGRTLLAVAVVTVVLFGLAVSAVSGSIVP